MIHFCGHTTWKASYCQVCSKSMRSSYLINHTKNKHGEGEPKLDLNDVAEKDQDLYYSKVEGGQQLYKLIESKNVDEITLSKEKP